MVLWYLHKNGDGWLCRMVFPERIHPDRLRLTGEDDLSRLVDAVDTDVLRAVHGLFTHFAVIEACLCWNELSWPVAASSREQAGEAAAKMVALVRFYTGYSDAMPVRLPQPVSEGESEAVAVSAAR